MIIKNAFKYINNENSTVFSTFLPENISFFDKLIYIEAEKNKRIIQNNQLSFITKYLTEEEYLTSDFKEEDDPKAL